MANKNANRMKPISMIPETASSLRVVALNRKKIEFDSKDEHPLRKEKSNGMDKQAEEKKAEKKKKAEAFEYRIKEKKHDPL